MIFFVFDTLVYGVDFTFMIFGKLYLGYVKYPRIVLQISIKMLPFTEK